MGAYTVVPTPLIAAPLELLYLKRSMRYGTAKNRADVMLSLASPQQSIYASSALLCSLCACVTDVRERRIPNAFTGASILAGLLLHVCVDGWHGLLYSSGAGFAAGALFLVFYLAGGIGAGDVKLIAAIGCMNGFSSLGRVLLITVFSGGVLALALAFYRGQLLRTGRNVILLLAHHGRRGLHPHAALNVTNHDLLRIPYAIPIALGCAAAVWTAWSGSLA